MNTTIATIYAAVLHLAGLTAITILTAIGAITSDVGLPLIAGLLGLGVGTGTAVVASSAAPVAAPVAATPAASTVAHLASS